MSGEKSFLCANLQFLVDTFREMGTFLPFLTLRVPQKGKKF